MVWRAEEEVTVSANYITNERGKSKADIHTYTHTHPYRWTQTEVSHSLSSLLATNETKKARKRNNARKVRWGGKREVETAQRICDFKQHELNNNDIHRNLTSFDIHFMSFQPTNQPFWCFDVYMCVSVCVWLRRAFARSLAQMFVLVQSHSFCWCSLITCTYDHRAVMWVSNSKREKKGCDPFSFCLPIQCANISSSYTHTHTHLNGNQNGKTYAAEATAAIYFGTLWVCVYGWNRLDVKK